MSFNPENITHKDSIKVGSDDAPVKVVEYINLRCPHSKYYEENIAPSLERYIEEGKVQRILKHFDKEKYKLELGSVLNQYLDYSTPNETFSLIKQLFTEQETWGNKRLSEIPHIAKKYGLTLQPNNREQAERINQEVLDVNVKVIPTIFVGGSAFDETIDLDQFKQTIEEKL